VIEKRRRRIRRAGDEDQPVVQNPYNRRQTIPERVRALNAAVPGDMTVFQKGFHWALQNPNLSGVVIGISDMAMAKEDIPLAMERT